MKILYVVMKYNMGYPEQGLSYEHYNFYDTLTKMDNSKHEIIYFPFDEIMLKVGKEKMNEMLVSAVKENKPDLCFFELITHQILPQTIKKITKSGRTITFNWFTDDEWRFDMFSRHYAPLFDWVSTTDFKAIEKYGKIRYKNVIKTAWACNNFLYKPDFTQKKRRFEHEVSFIGKVYGNRPHLVNKLESTGINVECWGFGWPRGKISQRDLIRTFSRSRINLNFSRVQRNLLPTHIAGIIFHKDIDRSVHINHPKEWIPRVRHLIAKPVTQTKGRVFEIPGCAALQTVHNDRNQ